jgi:hypothetical protein
MAIAQKHQPSGYFAVHGGTFCRESMGDKMWQLFIKLDAILGADFGMVKRHVLSMQFVFEYLKRCGAEKALLEGDFRRARKLIMDGKFTEGEMGTIEEICRDLGKFVALVARNSAFGDASGTGMLGNSFYLENSPSAAAWFAKRVIASYYVGESAQFRNDACLAEGIAVGIEPMVSQEFKDQCGETCHAPCISGFGKTYSHFYKDPYIGVAYGLSGEFMSNPKAGWIVMKHDLDYKARFRGNDAMELTDFSDSDLDRLASAPLSRETPLVFKNGRVAKARLKIYPSGAVVDFFRKMEKLAQNCGGVQQYIEYACRDSIGARGMEAAIVQIADIVQRKMSDFAAASGGIIKESTHVLGSAGFDSEWVIRMLAADGWNVIQEFNKTHKNYVLISEIDSTCKSVEGGFIDINLPLGYRNMGIRTSQSALGKIKYSDLSNAGLWLADDTTIMAISSHLGGCFEAAGRVIAELRDKDYERLERNAVKVEDRGAYRIYQIPTTIRASEYEQKCEVRLRA